MKNKRSGTHKLALGATVAVLCFLCFLASKEKNGTASGLRDGQAPSRVEEVSPTSGQSAMTLVDAGSESDPHALKDAEEAHLAPFQAWVVQWKAGAADLRHGLTLARERKLWMQRMIQDNPELAYRHAFDEELWTALPVALQAEVERKFLAEGTYRVARDCESEQVWRHLTINGFSTGKATVARGLESRDSFAGRMRGVVMGKLGAVVAMEGEQVPLKDFVETPLVEAAPVTGTYPVLWLNIKFGDEASGPSAGTAMSAAATAFNQYSYGRLTVSYDVVSVSISSTKASNPSDTTIQTEANAAAQALGYTPASYHTILYRQSLYGQYAGLSNSPGYVMLSKSVPETTIHEIAHNMGVHHANWWKPNAGQPSWGVGVNQLYGEDWDAMALDNPRGDFNVPEKIQLGWLDQSTDYVHDAGSGTYRIYDYRSNSRSAFSTSGVNGAYFGVSVFKDTAAVNGEDGPRRYLLSYRDRTAVGTTVMTEGLYLHWPAWTYNGSSGYWVNGPYGSDIIDTRPTLNSVNDAPLAIGETYVDNDPNNRDGDLFITVLSKTDPDGTPQNGDEYLDVKVVIGDQVGNNPPTGTLNFVKSTVAPGEAAVMSVSASDPNGDTLAYLWDFGLGTSTTLRNQMALNGSPNQTFTYSTAGTYTIKVTVSDCRGGTVVLTKVLTVSNAGYAVTYLGNGSDGGSAPVDAGLYLPGATVTVLGNTGNLVKTGSTFAGWNTQADGNGTSYASGATFAMPSANVNLYAKWTTLPTYTIGYNGNSNDGGSAPSNQTKIQGTGLALVGNTGNLVRTGYAFSGWNTQADGNGANYAVGETYNTDANLLLYAKWVAVPTYTVTYSGNGHTGGSAPSSQVKTQGINLVLRSNTGNLVKAGSAFVGWNTSPGGGGTDYAEGASYAVDSNLTLYSKWNAAALVNAGADQTVTMGSDAQWTPANMSAAPEFWLDAADASTITLDVSNRVTQWNDKSGKGHHVVQSSSTRRPTYSAIGWGGTLPQLQLATYGAQKDALGRDVTSDGISGSAYTLFVVLNAQSEDTEEWIHTSPNTGGKEDRFQMNNNGVKVRSDASNGGSLAGTYVAGQQILQFTLAATSSEVRRNGVQIAANNGTYTPSPLTGNFTVNGRSSSTGHAGMTGSIAEFIFLSTNPSAAERQSVEGYLAHKWNLAGSIPAEHPYKNSPPGATGVVINLDATVSDADGGSLTTTWSVVGGTPEAVKFGNSTAVDTSATFTQAGTYVLRLTANDGYNQSSDDITINVDPPPSAQYLSWAGKTFANPFTQTGSTQDPDRDGLNNRMEFAFGMDPTSGSWGALAVDGSAHGLAKPVTNDGGATFDLVFVRRDDHDTSGSVTYTVQFSGDMVNFHNSATTPSFVANSAFDAGYEVVKVPYPALLPDGRKATFGRIGISSVP